MFCVSILGYGFTLPQIDKILETWPSASRAKQLLEGMQQNKAPEKSQSVLCSKMLCNIFNENIDSAVHRLFLEKIALAN